MNQPLSLSYIKGLLHKITIITGLLIIILPPTIVGYIEYKGSKSELEFRTQVITRQIAQFASIQGKTWEYSFHRLLELTAIGDPDGKFHVHICIYDGDREVDIFQSGPAMIGVQLDARKDIVVRGKNIGFIILSLNADKIIHTIFFVFLGSLCLGGALFAVFNKVSLRVLNQMLTALEASRTSLVTEVNLKDAEAERANKASGVKSDFLAHMSHEMRTPLNAIIGFSEVMKLQIYGDLNKTYMNYAADIHNSGNHLLALVNSVLDLSKIEQNVDEVNLNNVVIEQVINETTTLMRLLAQDKAIALNVVLDKDLPNSLVSDYTKIYQILINLVSNSVKYTEVGGRVTINAVPSVDGVEISVEDTGIGIASEDIDTALAAFGQVKNAFTAKVAGTGLGLTIAASYTELLGGALVIASEEGIGTKVTLTFPLVLEDGNHALQANDDNIATENHEAV